MLRHVNVLEKGARPPLSTPPLTSACAICCPVWNRQATVDVDPEGPCGEFADNPQENFGYCVYQI